MLRRWQSWLTIFTMSEDDNEGVFGPPPPTGNADRISQQMLGRGPLRYQPTANTLRGWAEVRRRRSRTSWRRTGWPR